MAKGKRLFRNWHGPDPRGGIPVRHGWIAVPALTVISLIRTPVGNKVAAPLNAIVVAGGLYLLTPFAWLFFGGLMDWHSLPGNIGHEWLAGFLALCVVASCFIWVKRMFGIQRGEEIHQMEAGYSWLAWYMPLPPWFTELAFVPAIFMGAGWFFYTGPSRDLGGWLAVCGVSFLWLGLVELRHRVAVAGSISDQLIQGQSAGQSVDMHVAKASSPRNQTARAHAPQFAEAASGPAAAPDGFMERPGRGGGLFVFRFGKSRTRIARPAAAPPKTGRWDPEPRNYAEPGT